MLYAIIGRDVPGTLEQRLTTRPAHLERLNALLAEGRLVLARTAAGHRQPDPASRAAWWSPNSPRWKKPERADADPYVAAGVYAAVEIYPFRKLLPA